MSYATVFATISGYATTAEVKQVKGENELLTFKLPVGPDGDVTWYQVEFWNGSMASAINRFQDTSKIRGAKITLQGNLKVKTWKSQNGGSGVNLVIQNPTILEFYPKNATANPDEAIALPPVSEVNRELIPHDLQPDNSDL